MASADSLGQPWERHLEVVARQLRERLIEERRAQAAVGRLRPGPLAELIADLVDREVALLSDDVRADIARRILREATGLGPLEELLEDPLVEEVMVNGPDAVFVGREGRVRPAPVAFESELQLREAIERVLAPLGRRVDETSPMVDARLPDGSRLNVVLPPLAVDGPMLTIRRFTAVRPGPEALLDSGTLDPDQFEMLRRAVGNRRALLVSGGTGAGKTTLLNALSAFIPAEERIVTIEDAAELQLVHEHVVRLESRPASAEGAGQITIRDLLRNALRMRPDRILIGEVRGAEALELLSALNTGHAGALCTIHANSPAEALSRLETLALMAESGLPFEALRRQVRAGIDLVVHIERTRDGGRRVTAIEDVAEL